MIIPKLKFFKNLVYLSLFLILIIIILLALNSLLTNNQKLINFSDNFNTDIFCSFSIKETKSSVELINEYQFEPEFNYQIPVFPEIKNILCIGKLASYTITGNIVKAQFITNDLIYKIILFLYLTLITLSYFFLKNRKSILLLLLLSMYSLTTFLFVGSFNNLNLNLIEFGLLGFIFLYIVDVIFFNKKNNNFEVFLPFLILLFTNEYLNFLPFVLLVSLLSFTFLFFLIIKKILKINNSDYLQLILYSTINATVSSISIPFTGNHLNYMPKIIYDSFGYLEKDFLLSTNYPYPLFNYLTNQILKVFGFEIINILNYVTEVFVTFIVCLFIKTIYPAFWKSIFLMVTFFTSNVLLANLSNLANINKNTISSYLISAIGNNSLFTSLYQPSMFDVLILILIIFIIQKKFYSASITSVIMISLHTYNLLPVLCVYLAYFFSEKISIKISIKKIKDSFFLLLSLPLIYIFNLKPLSSTLEELILMDKVMTYKRIPIHRLFNGNISVFSNSNFEKLITLTDYQYISGFNYQLEFLILSIVLFFKLKNKFLKIFFLLINLIVTLSILLFITLQNDTIFAIIRNLTPWKLANITYLIGFCYVLKYLVSIFKNNKIFENGMVFVFLIFIFSINTSNLSNDFNNIELTIEPSPYQGLNLINPQDRNIVFITFTFKNKNFITFNSTTANFVAHPYGASDILNWNNQILKYQQFVSGDQNCSSFFYLLESFNAERALFSDIYFVPDFLKKCENLKYDTVYGIYIYEK